MIFIADANIILSAIINPHGRVANLFYTSCTVAEFIIPKFALTEIKKHKAKICTKGKISPLVFDKLLSNLLNNMMVINDEDVLLEHIDKALTLTKNIDTNDALYIALAIGLDIMLWTGDLKLHYAMRRKKFVLTITTAELESIIKGI